VPSSPIGRAVEARRNGVAAVVIGVDPHKLSATIEVVDEREKVLGGGRFGTDRVGYRQMLASARRWPDRLWAVEGCNGIGRHVAQRLVADGEQVVDVPAKLSARARVFSTGHGRKTDATDAHSIAVVAVRTTGLPESRSTTSWWLCGCWPTAVTSSPAPAPAQSIACTG
jgi:transposase